MRSLAIFLFSALVLATEAPAATIIFTDTMLGSNEVPPTGSPAIGSAILSVDTTANTLGVIITFSGLTGGPATASHIHCCTPAGTNAGVALPFTGFPNTTSGMYTNTFDLTLTATYSSTFLTASGGTAAGAEAALIAAMNTGLAYTNIHNAQFTGGEIRGQLANVVPEPATVMMSGAALLLVASLRRRYRPFKRSQSH